MLSCPPVEGIGNRIAGGVWAAGSYPVYKEKPTVGIFFLPVAILRGSAIFWNELEVVSHYGSKGRQQRRIPFWLELRKVLFRHITEFRRQPHDLLTSTRNGMKLRYNSRFRK